MKSVHAIIAIMKPRSWVPLIGRRLKLRERDLLTRQGGLRLRYVVPVMALALVPSLAALIHPAPADGFGVSQIAAMESEAPEARLAMTQQRLQRYAGVSLPEGGGMAGDEPAGAAPREKTMTVGKGDTLAGLLQRAGVPAGQALDAVKALQKHFNPKHIRPGQEVYVRFEPAAGQERGLDFAEMRMDIDPLKSVSLQRSTAEDYKAQIQEKPVETRLYAKQAQIEVSLYGSAVKAGIPAAVVNDVLRVYSWDIDFQRDVRRGDSIEVMYDQAETAEGVKVKSGDVIYARLTIGGQDISVYRYEMPDGDVDYFTADGASVRKALMKTPIDGARLSSGFGMRRHPVLGYNKMHKGVDFAAPRGTPIYAAGDGTVEKAGKLSSYGNYIKIRHNSSLKTAYAHLNGFAKGITPGKRVKQGQVIGYVGTTGRSTGPHLHYEVMVNGVQVNPNSIKQQQGNVLSGKQLAAFRDHVKRIDREYRALLGGDRLALRQLVPATLLR